MLTINGMTIGSQNIYIYIKLEVINKTEIILVKEKKKKEEKGSK